MDARAQPGNAVRERRCHGHERERLFSRGLARAPGEGVRRNFYCDELSDGGVGVVLGMCQTTKLFEMIIPIRIITCTSHRVYRRGDLFFSFNRLFKCTTLPGVTSIHEEVIQRGNFSYSCGLMSDCILLVACITFLENLGINWSKFI